MVISIFRKLYSFLLDALQTLLLAAAVFLVIYTFLFRPFEVKGSSMNPNFVDKEYVLTNIIALRFSEPKFGDVIVFKAPPDPEKDFIKRVIGLPNDEIMIKDGQVFRNRKPLDESSYLKPDIRTYGGSFLQEGEILTVPQGQYFIMGDNRPYSSDSREWGFIKKTDIIGQSFFVYWPPDKIGFVKNRL